MAKVDFVSFNVYFKIKDPKDAKDDLYASVSVSDVSNINELTGTQIADDLLHSVQNFVEAVGASMKDVVVVSRNEYDAATASDGLEVADSSENDEWSDLYRDFYNA